MQQKYPSPFIQPTDNIYLCIDGINIKNRKRGEEMVRRKVRRKKAEV